MAVRPNTPPVPGTTGGGGRPPGAGGNLRRLPPRAPQSVGPVAPGSVRPSDPRVPPTTPFQPGARPSPPLSPIGAGLGGLLLLGQALWDLLNGRPPEPAPPEISDRESTLLSFPGGRNVRINFGWVITGSATDCNNGNSRSFTVGPVNSSVVWNGVFGVRITGTNNQTRSGGCPGGFGISGSFGNIEGLDQNGNVALATGALFSGGTGSGSESGSLTLSMPVEVIDLSTGQPVRPAGDPRPPVLPQVAPVLPDTLPEVAPEVAPAPQPATPAPVAPPAPAVAPPFPVPAPIPGGAPGRAPGRAPGSAPAPAPLPAPGGSPARPQGVPITAGGVRPQLPPAGQPTNTGTTFLPGGRPLVPNGPPATMEGIATELGKLEQKMEIMLNPDDSLSPLELLNKVIDQIENIEFLIERLFPPGPYEFGPGEYELEPVCDRDAEGNLIPALVAPWAGGQGEFTELRQRLDALAVLIQHHKTLKQPTCGARGNGPHSNVTVHFESD